MNPTIPLIILGCCALTSACSTTNTGGTRDPDDLEHFYLPEVRVRDASLETALEEVEELYREASRQSGQKPRPWQVTVTGTPTAQVNADLESLPAGGAIRLLAAKAGMTTELSATRLKLTAIPPDDTVVTRRYAVPPTIQSDLPTAYHRKSPTRGRLSELEFLRREGFLKSPSSRLSYEPRSSHLTVTATGFEQQQLKALLDVYLNVRPTMIRISTRRMTFDEDPGLPTGVFSERATGRWLRNASGRTSSPVEDLPSIVARPEQSGTIEVTRESNRSGIDWAGTKLRLSPGLIGHAIVATIDYERRVAVRADREVPAYQPGAGTAPLAANREFEELLKAPSGPMFRTRELRAYTTVPNHGTLILSTTGTSTRTEYVLLTLVRIDASGTPIGRP